MGEKCEKCGNDGSEANALRASIEREQENNRKLTKALSFYGNEMAYRAKDGAGFTSSPEIVKDKGKTARIALGLLP